MDVDKFITLAEKYLREFILYLVSFFWKGDEGAERDAIFQDLNRSVVFAVFSAVLGAYLWDRYILRLSGRSDDVIGLLADNLLRWMSLGLVLYALMRAAGLRPHILLPIMAVLKVFSVAHVVAIYAAYLLINVIRVFVAPSEFEPLARDSSVTAAYLIELLILLFYFPKELGSIAGGETSRGKLNFVRAGFLLLITLVVLLPIAEHRYDVAHSGSQEAGSQSGEGQSDDGTQS